MTEMVKLDKVWTTMLQPGDDYKNYVEVTEWEYKQLCKKYGSYSFSWYFTEFGSIKYFDGEWNYERNWRRALREE